MKVTMDQKVRWNDGTVASPREMIDKGLAEVKRVDNFKGSSRAKPRKATFVDLVGTTSGVEVSGYVK